MTRPGAPKYAPFYDLFKLIVAVILTILLVLLLLRSRQEQPVPISGTLPTPTVGQMIQLSPTPTFEQTAQSLPTATPQAPLPTPTSPVETAQPLSSATPQSALPTPTLSLSPVPTEIIPASDPNDCPSSPSRIQVGDRVRVLSWLNFRTGPGRHWPIIWTNISGTVMEVVDGPVCTTRDTAAGSKAYLWWKVRMENGREGWSAEAPLIDPVYFLEPER